MAKEEYKDNRVRPQVDFKPHDGKFAPISMELVKPWMARSGLVKFSPKKEIDG